MTPLYHRYHIFNKQRSQNVRTQLRETLDLNRYRLTEDKNKSFQGVFGNLASWRLCSMRADGPDRPSSSYGCITRDLEMNSRMLGGPGVSVRGLCPLPGVGALVHVRAAPGS